jgi:hypothetical protein
MNGRQHNPPLKLIKSSDSRTADNKTATPTKPNHLQVVVGTQSIVPQTSANVTPRKAQQLSLFEEGERVLLGIVNVDRIRGSQFEALLRNIRPKWLIDLRTVPHFLIDRLNRLYVFDIFDECHIRYVDIMSTLDIRTQKDASLSSGRIAQAIAQLWSASGANTVLGSVIFLVDDDEIAQLSAKVFPEKLEPRPKAGWDTRFLN